MPRASADRGVCPAANAAVSAESLAVQPARRLAAIASSSMRKVTPLMLNPFELIPSTRIPVSKNLRKIVSKLLLAERARNSGVNELNLKALVCTWDEFDKRFPINRDESMELDEVDRLVFGQVLGHSQCPFAQRDRGSGAWVFRFV